MFVLAHVSYSISTTSHLFYYFFADTLSLPHTLTGGPSGLGLSGVGFRRASEDMEEAAEDIQVLEEVGAAVDLQPDSSMDTTANATERELQQTSVQAFINSYQGPGGRFNDTGPTGITGAIPGGHTQPQVAHSPVVTGGSGGVVFGGGAQAGAPGIAGGTFPTLGT